LPVFIAKLVSLAYEAEVVMIPTTTTATATPRLTFTKNFLNLQTTPQKYKKHYLSLG